MTQKVEPGRRPDVDVLWGTRGRKRQSRISSGIDVGKALQSDLPYFLAVGRHFEDLKGGLEKPADARWSMPSANSLLTTSNRDL